MTRESEHPYSKAELILLQQSLLINNSIPQSKQLLHAIDALRAMGLMKL